MRRLKPRGHKSPNEKVKSKTIPNTIIIVKHAPCLTVIKPCNAMIKACLTVMKTCQTMIAA